ncbi:MAG: ATP-binding cassette domain-containing protein [Myxococcales bacterium]
MDGAEAIVFEQVSKSFGDNVIYTGLDLRVRSGEILTILGGSGSGKSVMLKMMLGLVKPDQGRVLVAGDDLNQLGGQGLQQVRRKVGMLFQGSALFDSMDVFDNVSYALVERCSHDEAAVRERVAQVLEMVGLPGTEALMPNELSGGMKKRVALARAVAEVPDILLYDEPTTGLDPMNVRRISELILRLRDELHVTSIVVTHDLASAFFVSDRLAMLADRRITEIDEPQGFRESARPEVQEFLGAMQVVSFERENRP